MSPAPDSPEDVDPHLAFTVSTVWREERISCPHPHILESWRQGGLPGGATEFVEFHLRESKCPYCNAIVDDLAARDGTAKNPVPEDLRDRLLRSTTAALRRNRA